MNHPLKWLVLASLTNLVGNSLGTMLALQHNLTGNFGSWLNGQDVLRDFLGFKGTALSAPLPFMLIQLGLTLLALRPGRSGRIGVGGLTIVGALYTIGQLGEPIVLRVWSPGGFDPAQAFVLFVNVASSSHVCIWDSRVENNAGIRAHHRLALSSGAQPVSRKGKPSCCYAIHPRRTDREISRPPGTPPS